VGLVSRVIEEKGIPTVTLAMERDVTAPRVAFVPFPYNFPMGEPEKRKRHRQVALAALELLYELHEPGEVELPLRWWRREYWRSRRD
jgi:D-proline reductase (dithiol) PrdB